MKIKSFNPKLLPIELSKDEIIKLLKYEAETLRKIERFNTILERSAISEEILMMFFLNESVQSTRIEGTQTSLTEVVESSITGNTNKDAIEVLNYYQALLKTKNMLGDLPISTRMFHKLHKILLQGSRGESRSPGEFRKVQNFIGPTNNIKDATYIPPSPDKVNYYIGNLEEYINNSLDNYGVLTRTAIIHGQFETIHPYLDGNGRLGRILIIIYLLKEGIIKEPNFFLSEELEKNKYKYYQLLNNLRLEEPKWFEWIEFFIKSSDRQADKYIEKLESVEELYRNIKKVVIENNIPVDVARFIFKELIFTINQMSEKIGVSYNTARRYVRILEENRIIFGDDKKRNRKYYNYDIINLLG